MQARNKIKIIKEKIKMQINEKSSDFIQFEGIVSVRALLIAAGTGYSPRRIERIVVAEERAESSRKEFGWLRARSAALGFELCTAPRSAIDAAASGSTHGGIIAYCEPRDYPALDADFIKRTRKLGFYVMIEGIEDPYNFGYALRSVYSAGVDGIVLSPRNWLSAAGTVCRSSAGASELADITTASGEDAARIFRSAGFRIIGTDLNDSVSVYDANLHYPLLLIIGGEKRGISRTLKAVTDEIVRLDYGRDFPEALSAASAAAILSFEVLRQNRY